MQITPAFFEKLLPLACVWAEEQEQIILRDGVALSQTQLSDAYKLKVVHPEKVRLLKVNQIPIPQQPELRTAAEATNLISQNTVGLTLRYGIFIRADYWNSRPLVAHELVHTSQYEKLGGFSQFLQKYLYECLTIGYPKAPMEQEAINSSALLRGSQSN